MVDRRKTATLEADDLHDLGVLRCYLTPGDMARLSAAALEAHLADMHTCPLSVRQGRALYKAYANHFPYVYSDLLVNLKDSFFREMLFTSLKQYQCD